MITKLEPTIGLPNFELSKEFTPVNHSFAPSIGDEDDFHYGDLIDRVDQLLQVSQTDSSITTQAWSWRPNRF